MYEMQQTIAVESLSVDVREKENVFLWTSGGGGGVEVGATHPRYHDGKQRMVRCTTTTSNTLALMQKDIQELVASSC